MADLINYKCKACGGQLKFSSQNQKLICIACNALYNVSEYEAEGGIKKQTDYQTRKTDWNLQQQGLTTYECKTCGGEIIGSVDLASTKCPFCNSPAVITNKIRGYQEPDIIIPFKYNKQYAEDQFRAFISEKAFAPKDFKDELHIKEINGIYVPYWVYDIGVNATAKYEGKKVEAVNEHVYDIYRECDATFEKIAVDASRRFDDKITDALNPYDLDEAVPFSSAYMAGYYAYKYDDDAYSCQFKAESILKEATMKNIANTISGYDLLQVLDYQWDVKASSYKYAMFPVWFLNTKYKGQDYYFAMNAQTGKITGDVPFCSNIIFKRFIVSFLILNLFAFVFCYFSILATGDVSKDYMLLWTFIQSLRFIPFTAFGAFLAVLLIGRDRKTSNYVIETSNPNKKIQVRTQGYEDYKVNRIHDLGNVHCTGCNIKSSYDNYVKKQININ